MKGTDTYKRFFGTVVKSTIIFTLLLPVILGTFSCRNPLQDIIERDISMRYPGISVKQGTTDIAAGAVFDFGEVEKNTAKDVSFVIYNTGAGDLTLTGDPLAAVSGADAADFSVTEPPAPAVPAGGNSTFTVRLESAAVGAKIAAITIVSNDANTGSYVVNLTATVTEGPQPDINVRQGSINLPDGTGEYVFGNVYPDGDDGTTSAVKTFTVENIGTADLTITGVSLAGGDIGDFDLTDSTSTVVPYTGANYTTFTIRFDPIAIGEKTSTVLITNSDPDEGEYTFTVTGTATLAPTVTTTAPVPGSDGTTAASGGNVVHEGGSSVTARGVCWSETSLPTTADGHTDEGAGGTGSFVSNITGLTPGTYYYVRAYAVNSNDIAYGDEYYFTTYDYPSLSTNTVSILSNTTATSGGNITSNGGIAVTVSGVCWSTSANPTTADSKTTDGTAIGSYASSLTGLIEGNTYHVRAYATNSVGTAYGSDIAFSMTKPTVTTTAHSGVTSSTASSGGVVSLFAGAAAVTSRGVCWSTSMDPTIADSKTTNGSGEGTFTSSLTGLNGSTTYHVRAYATNAVGTDYGLDDSFTTSAPVVPTLTTTAISGITGYTASSGGNITDGGGASVSARGVCWGTSTNPVATGSHTTDGSGTGSFTSSLTGLSAGTLYYVRAYATNSAGTAYGNEVTFTTDIKPTVTTTAISGIHATYASGGGNVTTDGGETVTARGVCWNTTGSPTTGDSKTTNGTGTGTFASSLTLLTVGQTYYVRAYATNSVDTAYGGQVSFQAVYAIGDTYQSGIIFYLTGSYPAQHGYVAAPSDQSTGQTWSNVTSSSVGGTGTAIGTGAANTTLIIGQSGHSASAAKVCDDYTVGGYDWFLPSKDELNAMYQYRSTIGGFDLFDIYWSSSESAYNKAWEQSFYSGEQISDVKIYSRHVRSIHAF